MKLVARRVRAGRTVVRVGVTRGGRAVAAVQVVARRVSRRRVLAAARTNAAGRASLAFGGRRGRVRIAVPARPRCGAVGLSRRGS